MRYTPLLALAMGNVAMGQFTNSTTTTGTRTGTDTSTGPTGSATGDADVGNFEYLGCFGSSNGFPTFSIETSSNEMTTELCAASCEGSEYFGVYTGDCYCGDELESADSTNVGDEACNIPCPGDESERCGGNSGPLRLARRQVPTTVFLSVFVRIAVGPSVTVTATGTVTETGTVTGVPETVTVTDGTSVYTTVINPAPTNIVIICFGDYCAPEVDCGCDTKWRVVCEDDHCRPEECDKDDEYWNRLVVCHDGECEYPTCKGDECHRKILCTGDECHHEACHGDECEKKLVCTGDDCKHETCTGDDCYCKETCDDGHCKVEPQCDNNCPVPPAPKPAPTSSKHEGPFTPSKPVESGSSSNNQPEAPVSPSKPEAPVTPAEGEGSKGNDNKGESPAIVTAGSGKMIPAVGITAFGMVAGLAFLL